ncbi:MAG: hypothetical protein H0U61_14650 [Nocardioidaceae bacterium]|nr:hypothetical protein [Nocardioidaceae bacterium]
MSVDGPLRHIAITHVAAHCAAEFDAMVREVIVPLVGRTRPHVADEWSYLVPDKQPGAQGELVYAFLFYGDASLDEWELEPMFVEGHGQDEGRRLNERFESLLIRQEAHSFSLEAQQR